jgi:alpha-amylase
MKKLKLVLGVHSGQPVGTSEEQFEQAYQYSYKPFLTVLYKYPKVKTAIHFSGVLLEWFESSHPEYMMLINEMVKRRQVELIGGGFYSPALPIIPSKDRVGQLEQLTTYIRRRFGKRPRGCWITEGVWEPALASTIKSSGMEYLFLDDIYFEQAGIGKEELYSPFVTDDQGKSVIVLPLHNDFITSAFDVSAQEYMRRLVELKTNEGESERILSVMWNGEYFYANPDRYEDFFSERGWLEQFLFKLSEHAQDVQTILPGKYLRGGAPFRRIYFPGSLNVESDTGLQSDCGQQRLATATGRREINSYFRKNIVHYPESGRLYGKMMYVHLIVGQVRRDRSRKKTAKEESWKGQGHDPFWHGPGGGIYDNRLRKAAYARLIEAEKTTREKGIFSTTVNVIDIDLDGADEYLYQGQFINAYVHRRGGSLFELDYVVTSWNYQDVMARYREPYHDEKDEKNGIDTAPRSSFVDHFFYGDTKLEDLLNGSAREKCDFADSFYYPEKVDKDHKDLELDTHKWLHDAGGEGQGSWLHLHKYFDFQKNSINVTYTLHPEKGKSAKGLFATELNLSFPESDKDKLVYTITSEDDTSTEVLDGKIDFKQVKELAIHDRENKTLITLTPSDTAMLWTYPVYSVTMRYGEKRRMYQGSCYIFLWKCELGGNNGGKGNGGSPNGGADGNGNGAYRRSISMRIEKR